MVDFEIYVQTQNLVVDFKKNLTAKFYFCSCCNQAITLQLQIKMSTTTTQVQATTTSFPPITVEDILYELDFDDLEEILVDGKDYRIFEKWLFKWSEEDDERQYVGKYDGKKIEFCPEDEKLSGTLELVKLLHLDEDDE